MNVSLWDRIVDWLVLVAAIALSGVLLVARNDDALRGLRTRALEWTASLENRLASVGAYVGALEENQRLRADNIRLSSQVARLRGYEVENRQIRGLLGLADTLYAEIVAANVITREITSQQGMLTLDVGARDGIRTEMPVVDPSGIVGKTVLVSERFSRVMPLMNTDLRLPGKIQPTGAAGILRWQGDRRDRLIMEHVVKTEAIEVGQTVVASGHSQIFPPDYPIGQVDSISVRPGRVEFTIFVRPAANVDATGHVFVMLALPDSERTELEQLPVR